MNYLLALGSIYDADESRKADSVQGGETRIYLDLPRNFKIFVSGNSNESLQNNGFEYTICFLPPLVLNFELPPDYPSSSSPSFTLSGKWLSPTQVKELEEAGLFARYDLLLLQSTLDRMADVVYCPCSRHDGRAWGCQGYLLQLKFCLLYLMQTDLSLGFPM